MRPFLCAVGFLTRLPLPGGARDADAAMSRAAVAWFPAVGALIGLAIGGLVWALGLVLPIMVAVATALAIELWLTDAVHEGALASCFDAFGSEPSRDHALQRLDDDRIGTYGVCALALGLLIRVGAIASMETHLLVPALVTASAAGRWILVGVMVSLPPLLGRNDVAEEMAEGLEPSVWMRSGAALLPGLLWLVLVEPWPAALALLAAFGTFLGAVQFFARRLGGTTVDALGAVASVTQTAVLVFASVRWLP